jgi:DNA-binding transcriptional MerR regulator
VCDLVKLQPYVLRSWEAEFPDLGVSKAGSARVYRRADVEQVLRIKHLLLVEGLTLAGARRKLEEETGPVVPDEPAMQELLGRNARERLTAVRRGLQSILDILASRTGGNAREFRLTPPTPAASRSTRSSPSTPSTSSRAADKRAMRAARAKSSSRKPASARPRPKPRSRSRSRRRA